MKELEQKHLEIKERLFALYWNQRVLIDPDYDDHEIYVISATSLRWNIDECHLLLRSIQSLSDEECIEVAKILGADTGKFSRDELIHDGKSIVGELRPNGFLDIPNWDYLALFDYLRSISIALPYMGISVEKQIERGWVKIKEI